MTTKKIFLTLTLIILLLAGCKIHHTNKVVVGLDDAYAPFGFRDENDNLVGFDIDLAEELAERMGIEIEFKAIDWDNKVAELESKKIDLLWSGFNITPEREKQMIFTKPYMENRQVVLVAKGKGKGIISVEDLAGKVVGTQLGAPSEYFINQDENLKHHFSKFVTYDNYEHAFQALADGEVDAIVCDELVVRYEMSRHHDKFEVIETTVGPVTEIAIGLRKSDTKLRDSIQAAFDEIIADGTASKISIKWFQADLIKSHI